MNYHPSTDSLDDRAIHDTQLPPEGNSDLLIDGLPIEDFVTPVPASQTDHDSSTAEDDPLQTDHV